MASLVHAANSESSMANDMGTFNFDLNSDFSEGAWRDSEGILMWRCTLDTFKCIL